MPAKDAYRDAVKNTLIKDGWTIMFDPYFIRYAEVRLVADLAGEKSIAAAKENRQIVIEVKSFLGRSPMREFETALGQYFIYFVNAKNEKIYLEEDWTEEGIATELLREGVPKEDIVLAFHEPKTRKVKDVSFDEDLRTEWMLRGAPVPVSMNRNC